MANETWIRGPSTSAKISGVRIWPQTTHHRQFSAAAAALMGLTPAAQQDDRRLVT